MKYTFSYNQWLNIGNKMGWIKTAQEIPNVNVLPRDPSAVLDVISQLGSTRYTIGFHKTDGSYRIMHAQSRVNKFQQDNIRDQRRADIREDNGLILVYDTSVASQIAKDLGPDVDPMTKEKALRRAYRNIYPSSVEFIKGRGQIWVVEGALEPANRELLEHASAVEEENSLNMNETEQRQQEPA